MKLTRHNRRYRFYQLSPGEAQMFVVVVSQFPLLKAGYQRSSLTGEEQVFDEADKLLAAATALRKRKLRKELRRWLRAPGRLKATGHTVELRVEPRRIEWLLQILNDIRVGCWVNLKSPADLALAHQAETKDAHVHLALMEMAGMFLSVLLDESAG